MEYSRILAIFVTFLCVARAVWQESAEGVCVPTRLSVTTVVHCLQNLIIPHLVSQWLQAKEPVGPLAVGVARGVGGTHG